MTFAIHHIRRLPGNGPWEPRDEPTWHDSTIVMRLLNAAGCSNLPGVQAAFSLGMASLTELTTARNFIAHRSDATALKLRRLGLGLRLGQLVDPSDVLTTKAPGRPQSVLEDWLDDIRSIFSLMPS